MRGVQRAIFQGPGTPHLTRALMQKGAEVRGVQRAIFQVALGHSRVTAGTQPAPQTGIWTEDPAGLRETWGRCLLWLFVLGALGS